MRTSLKLIAATGVLIAVGTIGSIAVAKEGKAGVTLGQLAVRLASIIEVSLPTVEPEAAAADALRRIGIKLDRDLDRMLTEADLVRIGAQLAIEVSSSDPKAPVGPTMSAAFARAAEVALWTAQATTAAEGNGDDDAHASCRGRAARAGRRGTPASPASPNATAGPCDDPGTP